MAMEIPVVRSEMDIRNAHFAAIIESSQNAITSRDSGGRIASWNRGAENLFGYTAREAIGQSMRQLMVPPDRWTEDLRFVARVMASDKVEEVKTVRRRKDGRMIDIEATLSPIKDAEGRVIGLSKIAHDITERKRLEEALHVSEAQFASAFEHAPIGIALVATEGRFVKVNCALCAMLGYSAEDLLGKSFGEITHSDDLEQDREYVRQMLAGELTTYQMEKRFLKESGAVVWALQSVSIVRDAAGLPMHFISQIQNVTEHKSVAEQMRLMATCVDRVSDIVMITEAEPIEEPGPRIVYVNEAFVRQTGYTREEVIGRSPRILQGPKTDRAELNRLHEDLRQWKHGRAEVINYTKSGEEICLDMDIVPVADARGWFTHWVAVERNITERKRTDDRMRRLVESNVQGVIFWKLDGAITDANDAFLRMVGYTRDELKSGMIRWNDLTPLEYADADRHAVEQLAAKRVCEPYEKEFIHKDGLVVPVLLGAATFNDNPNEGVCFVLDLTERKKLEEQFHRAQRMESIGTLAGGIAHDLNNALGPILMAIGLLKTTCTDPVSQEMLVVIEASAQHGAELVRQVLAFARGVEGRRMVVQVKHLVHEVERLVTETFPKNIQIAADLPSELWTVLGDPTQLQQVLMNFCVNARDAMPKGGKLTISAEDFMLDPHYATLNIEAHSGPYLLLEIEDTGMGIPTENFEKIFEPFFTTKEVGKGTGLGLSTSIAIIKSHGGFIRVYSEEGRGTKFKIYLPAQTEVSPEALAAVESAMPHGEGELIMVVDDEVSVRVITQQTLIAFGYRVVLASDGVEALAVYAKQGSEIAVVITDMMMPGMDGPATIQVLKKINPDVAIIASSGLSADGHVAHATRLGVHDFLSKPFTAGTLLQTLHQLLASKK